MKFASVALPLLAFVTYVAAQASYIGYPPAGAVVYEGQEVTVQIIKDNSMMLSIEVGLVLSFQYCPPPDPCPSPVDELENIMYIGKLNPAFQDSDFAYGNITVTIPNENVQSPTPGMIVENRVHLIGGGPAAILETNTVAVQLVGSY